MTTETEKTNGWWEKYVLKSLEDNDEAHRTMKQDNDEAHKVMKQDSKEIIQALAQLTTEVGRLQVKASMWGFVAGAVPTIGIILLKLV